MRKTYRIEAENSVVEFESRESIIKVDQSYVTIKSREMLANLAMAVNDFEVKGGMIVFKANKVTQKIIKNKEETVLTRPAFELWSEDNKVFRTVVIIDIL